MKTVLIIAIFAVSGLAFGGLGISSGTWQPQDQQTSKVEQIKQDARQAFMRGKLTSNQQIVEGLAIKDFDLVRDGAQGVTALVVGQHWFVLDTPEYKRFTQDMADAAARLELAAANKNIEAAALRYFDLTLTCIDCHQYLETVGN